MTLIAFHAGRDHADIITDTWGYTLSARRLCHTSKVMLLPHLDAAIVAQGSTTFANTWYVQAMRLAEQSPDFDAFTDQAPAELASMWDYLGGQVDAENREYGAAGTIANSVVFLVGYSPQHGRFTAYTCASDFGFQLMPTEGLHVQPSPLSVRPSVLELHRLERHFARFDIDPAPLAQLHRQPPPTPPGTPAEWVELAKTVRRDRGLVDLNSGFKTYVGGHVIHTRLTLGEASHRRVHTFDDSGDEFRTVVAGSFHPASQLGPCVCGSSDRYVDCCLAQIADQACPCGSGRTFAGCCSVYAESNMSSEGDLVGLSASGR